MKPIESEIIKTLTEAFAPEVLDVVNESDMHHGPPGRESHFKVYIVSDQFLQKSRLQRQRDVFAALDAVIPRIHALALKAATPEEHQKTSMSEFQSPQCASKRTSKL